MSPRLFWNGLVHVLLCLLALVGAAVLVWSRPAGTAQVGGLIYGVTMVLLFAATAAYQFFEHEDDAPWLRKVDHAAIFLYIGGCYTPVCLFKLAGATQVVMLSIIWSLSLLGAGIKLSTYGPPRWMSTSLYLALGWMGIFVARPILSGLPWAGVAWLFGGAALYTVGAFIYATKRCDFYPGVFGHHEVWHVCVAGASASHYILISLYILPC